LQYKPKKQPAKDRSFQQAHSEKPVEDEADARAMCAAKVAELQQGGFKILEESVYATYRSVGTDDHALVIGRGPNGEVWMVRSITGETWEEVWNEAEHDVHFFFCGERPAHHCDIYQILEKPADVVCVDRRQYPDYMRRFNVIQEMCRAHFKPGDYFLSSRKAERFTLSLYTGHGSQMIFENATLDANAVMEVKRWLEDRRESQDREDHQGALIGSVATTSGEEEQRC
jgi:hypothetical protein